jgi:hypothetical protein
MAAYDSSILVYDDGVNVSEFFNAPPYFLVFRIVRGQLLFLDCILLPLSQPVFCVLFSVSGPFPSLLPALRNEMVKNFFILSAKKPRLPRPALHFGSG